MSVPELRAKSTFPVRESFPKTTVVFDWLLYVAQRVDELVWQSKYLIFGISFLLFLVYELAHFAKFLLKKLGGMTCFTHVVIYSEKVEPFSNLGLLDFQHSFHSSFAAARYGGLVIRVSL